MAKITRLIDDITGKTDKEREIRERFTFLQKMAEGKSAQFKDELRVMLSNKAKGGQIEVVGDVAYEYHSSQHVNISSKCDDVIMDAVGSFLKGSSGLKEGFETLVKQGLAGLIGNTSLGEAAEDMFFVYPENYSIVRVDVKAYRYNFSSKGLLADDVESLFVYAMCKSIVDHKTVSRDYLMHAVVDMMRTDPDADPNITAVMDFIKQLVACWQLLDECGVDDSDVLKSAVTKPDETPWYVQRNAARLGLDHLLAANAPDTFDLLLFGEAADLTADEILRRARSFAGEAVKGLHETDGATPLDGRLAWDELFS